VSEAIYEAQNKNKGRKYCRAIRLLFDCVDKERSIDYENDEYVKAMAK
jgi:hypothetical protein